MDNSYFENGHIFATITKKIQLMITILIIFVPTIINWKEYIMHVLFDSMSTSLLFPVSVIRRNIIRIVLQSKAQMTALNSS